MIRKLHVQNFRMLRSCAIELPRLCMLAGPASSGRSTVLDALQLLRDVVSSGATAAVRARAPELEDLCFDPSRPVAIAIELVPPKSELPSVRYELELAAEAGRWRGVRIAREQLFVVRSESMFDEPPPAQQALFAAEAAQYPVVHDRTPRGWRKVVAKSSEGRDYFWDEGSDWHSHMRFGVDRSSLGSLPDDPERFPVAIGVRDFLREGVRAVGLEARKLRAPSAPGTACRLALDGSNLPHAVLDLKWRDAAAHERWVERVRLAIPGLASIEVRERENDRFQVLEVRFAGDRDRPVPSWCLSDAVLRVMALTLLPEHLSGQEELLLLDEVEAALHPRGVHVVFDALSSLPSRTQLVCSTSSPSLAARVERDSVVVMRRGADGAAQPLRGEELPDKPAWFEPSA